MKLSFAAFALAAAILVPTPGVAQFATVDNGPSATSTCQSAPALYYDQQNQLLETCGSNHTRQYDETALGVFNAQTAVTSVTTAQTMASLALNANAQNYLGRTFRICASGIYTTAGTTTPTLTFSVIEGGITPWSVTTGATSATASTSLQWSFCTNITTASISTSASPSTTGTLEAHGNLAVNLSANSPGAALTVYGDQNKAVSSAINLFSANTLAVQVAASGTVTSVQLRQMTIELIS
jgi:hypothetical protein